MGRTISSNVLERWIELHNTFVEKRGVLMVQEFLYLCCNSKDRTEMVKISEEVIKEVVV